MTFRHPNPGLMSDARSGGQGWWMIAHHDDGRPLSRPLLEKLKI